MKTHKLPRYILLALFGSALAVMTGFSQEDVVAVQDGAFERHTRPPVRFVHDEHNENAEIEECQRCHHLYEDGQLVEDESSEGMACSECHTPPAGGNPVELIRVYHLQCKGCHLDRRTGPIMCAECHRRE